MLPAGPDQREGEKIRIAAPEQTVPGSIDRGRNRTVRPDSETQDEEIIDGKSAAAHRKTQGSLAVDPADGPPGVYDHPGDGRSRTGHKAQRRGSLRGAEPPGRGDLRQPSAVTGGSGSDPRHGGCKGRGGRTADKRDLWYGGARFGGGSALPDRAYQSAAACGRQPAAEWRGVCRRIGPL